MYSVHIATRILKCNYKLAAHLHTCTVVQSKWTIRDLYLYTCSVLNRNTKNGPLTSRQGRGDGFGLCFHMEVYICRVYYHFSFIILYNWKFDRLNYGRPKIEWIIILLNICNSFPFHGYSRISSLEWVATDDQFDAEIPVWIDIMLLLFRNINDQWRVDFAIRLYIHYRYIDRIFCWRKNKIVNCKWVCLVSLKIVLLYVRCCVVVSRNRKHQLPMVATSENIVFRGECGFSLSSILSYFDN